MKVVNLHGVVIMTKYLSTSLIQDGITGVGMPGVLVLDGDGTTGDSTLGVGMLVGVLDLDGAGTTGAGMLDSDGVTHTGMAADSGVLLITTTDMVFMDVTE